MPLDRYRAVMRMPHVARLLSTSLVARLPNGMSGLAILLLVTRHHGYGRAGVVAGCYVAAAGGSNVLLARAADRWGPRRVLAPAGFGYALAMCGLALSDPYAGQLALAAAAGASSPPVVSVVRGLWPRLLPAEAAQAVYGLEATAQELIFIVGPALVAVVAAALGARAAVIAIGLCSLTGTLMFVSSPAVAGRVGAGGRERHRLLRTTRLPAYVACAVAITLAFNMIDVGAVAFVSGRHASAGAGAILAIWALGSMAGGLLFGVGTRVVDDDAVVRSVLLMALLGVAALAPGRVVLAVILLAGGGTLAPGLARLYSRVGAAAPDGAS